MTWTLVRPRTGEPTTPLPPRSDRPTARERTGP